MKEKIEAFAALVHTETEARLRATNTNENIIATYSKVTVKPGLKYTKVDVGTSGKYMVEMATGNIFGIKAYGVIHKGHWFGTVDTTAEYYWGEYSPTKKDGSLKTQKANNYPVLTFAPQPVAGA